MRGAKGRRILGVAVGMLVVAIAGFVAVGLILEDSWPARLLRGASVAGTEEPWIFPSEEAVSGLAVRPQSGRGLAGGITGTQVTFEGLWDGYCRAWGTDPNHPSGVKYYAGALKMRVEGTGELGYCIELGRNIEVGESYQANVYVSTDPELCAVYWILSKTHPDTPAPGLSGSEEGAAIQAALWHFVGGFQPLWGPGYWCGKEAVYDRTRAIIAAAQGQCLAVPDALDLTSVVQELKPGQTAGLTAHVYDQLGQPFPGQEVTFSTTLGNLGAAAGLTDQRGSVPNTLTSFRQGKATITADTSGHLGFAIVDPVDVPKQRVVILRSVAYKIDDSVEIAWEESLLGASITSFVAERPLGTLSRRAVSVTLRWQTAMEVGSLGFNLYRGPSENGPWTKLNGALIPSQVPPRSSAGAAYEWVDSSLPLREAAFYLLEVVTVGGGTSRYGPVSP
jgi:hypothetical protein